MRRSESCVTSDKVIAAINSIATIKGFAPIKELDAGGRGSRGGKIQSFKKAVSEQRRGKSASRTYSRNRKLIKLL